ncbi:Uncharacterized protein TCM_021888 [Theobroma cacao]|uniref:RNase H type-1 domain-containing protein n=1 Tax=Theobroma cacao TaxID=3641 RepID=A0A061ESS9_THECC|nr:Uncharacterized protein TCM_021888 [Theobroma cacao]
MSFFTIIWSIWLYRNEMIFDGKMWDLLKVMDIVKLRVAWWVKFKWPGDNVVSDIATTPLLASAPTSKRKVKSMVSWECPLAVWLKFNTDEAAKGCPGHLGIGGVLRANKGVVKVTFSKKAGWGDANLAEILAVREAMILFFASSW